LLNSRGRTASDFGDSSLAWAQHLLRRPAIVGITAVSNSEVALEVAGRGVFSKVSSCEIIIELP
jgi:hypothetical protein